MSAVFTSTELVRVCAARELLRGHMFILAEPAEAGFASVTSSCILQGAGAGNETLDLSTCLHSNPTAVTA